MQQQISIHAPREGSDVSEFFLNRFRICISIHAPREGSDSFPPCFLPQLGQFQSTLPVKGATMMFVSIRSLAIFQSTLPVKGATQLFYADGWGNFISIHAPREGSDRVQAMGAFGLSAISIHAPREGSDVKVLCPYPLWNKISIHAPREGSDDCMADEWEEPEKISIHAPREGSDSNVD